MGQRVPFLVKPHREAVAYQNRCGNMQKRELDIGHVDGAPVDIDGGDMQALLVVETRIPDGLGQGDDHRAASHGAFLCSQEAAFLYDFSDVVPAAGKHLRHHPANGIGCEELSTRLVVQFERMEGRPQDILRRVLQRHRDFPHDPGERLHCGVVIFADNFEISRFSRLELHEIDGVAHGDGRAFAPIGKDRIEVMLVTAGLVKLDDGFEAGVVHGMARR